MAGSRERPPADAFEDVGIAPLTLRTVRAELSFDKPAALDEALQRRHHHRHAEPVSLRNFLRRKGPVGSREAEHEIADGVGNRLEVPLRNPGRQRDAEGVAVAARILDGDETFLPRRRDLDDASLCHQFLQGGIGVDRRSRRQLGGADR